MASIKLVKWLSTRSLNSMIGMFNIHTTMHEFLIWQSILICQIAKITTTPKFPDSEGTRVQYCTLTANMYTCSMYVESDCENIRH
jgi:hypothetical protein